MSNPPPSPPSRPLILDAETPPSQSRPKLLFPSPPRGLFILIILRFDFFLLSCPPSHPIRTPATLTAPGLRDFEELPFGYGGDGENEREEGAEGSEGMAEEEEEDDFLEDFDEVEVLGEFMMDGEVSRRLHQLRKTPHIAMFTIYLAYFSFSFVVLLFFLFTIIVLHIVVS